MLNGRLLDKIIVNDDGKRLEFGCMSPALIAYLAFKEGLCWISERGELMEWNESKI